MSNAVPVSAEPWVPPSTFGSRLMLLRHHLGLTQLDAAKQCGLDDGSWSNWERGSKPRNMDQVVEAIAETFGCDRAWLMWGVSGYGYRLNAAGEPMLFTVVPGPEEPVQTTLPFDRQLTTV